MSQVARPPVQAAAGGNRSSCLHGFTMEFSTRLPRQPSLLQPRAGGGAEAQVPDSQ